MSGSEIMMLLLLFGRVSTLGQSQTGLWLRVYFLLHQATVLPGSDAGSDGIERTLDFVIQNHDILCSMWCMMYNVRSKSLFGTCETKGRVSSGECSNVQS